jgi:hypothetical protein
MYFERSERNSREGRQLKNHAYECQWHFACTVQTEGKVSLRENQEEVACMAGKNTAAYGIYRDRGSLEPTFAPRTSRYFFPRTSVPKISLTKREPKLRKALRLARAVEQRWAVCSGG